MTARNFDDFECFFDKVVSVSFDIQRNRQGYICVYYAEKIIVYIECDYRSPLQYAIKHKTGKFARKVYWRLYKGFRKIGCSERVSLEQADYILQRNEYDPRNSDESKRNIKTPEMWLSQSRRKAVNTRWNKIEI